MTQVVFRDFFFTLQLIVVKKRSNQLQQKEISVRASFEIVDMEF